ncbi:MULTISPECIES: secondary thiamine-phosphate synthase enzyme YjbQ [unclassified Xanthobacter]|uniref:secondary thiamine-phosphate synthase enzyme YjbQ n=1 Tax=unclassified Xanthobacter TaxID=2623496 RepID=UPI001F0108D7|nr:MULTISPECIES: secondary thiamine-phosphate synthase enzyme YjbQ [unclassified Xanthobacter]
MSRLNRSPARISPLDTHAECRLAVTTSGEGFTDITREAAAFLTEIGARDGVLMAFCRHTSASLTIQENADSDVQRDLLTALDRLAPQNGGWVHDMEGPDDMPAHIRTLLSGVSLAIPVSRGSLALGTWQGLYLIEHRHTQHRREVVLAFSGCTMALG